MPTLVILRHAEAEPSKTDDHVRPLTPRGRADAIAVGRALQVALASPPLVMASDAQRTTETAELAFSAFPAGVDLRSMATLYSAPPAVLLRAVREAPATADVLVLVGHNPGISEFAKQLIGSAADGDRTRVLAGLPTAGAAIFAFDGLWSEVGPQRGRLTTTLLPAGKS